MERGGEGVPALHGARRLRSRDVVQTESRFPNETLRSALRAGKGGKRGSKARWEGVSESAKRADTKSDPNAVEGLRQCLHPSYEEQSPLNGCVLCDTDMLLLTAKAMCADVRKVVVPLLKQVSLFCRKNLRGHE